VRASVGSKMLFFQISNFQRAAERSARHSAPRLGSRTMTTMDVYNDAQDMEDPRSRLVFDDADAEMVDAEDAREHTPERVSAAPSGARAPRVLTTMEEAALTASGRKDVSSSVFSRFNASLGDFFRAGEKRERVASPAVKSNRRKSVGGGRMGDVSRVVRDLASILDEPKLQLLARAVDAIGEARCREFVDEALRVQNQGGEMTATGERKRTTGGVFWAHIRAQCTTEEVDVIFAEEREIQKQRAKIRRARTAAMGKENVPPVGVSALQPTMAQILFGSIRQEHFAPRSPLATISPVTVPNAVVDCDVVTPKATIKTASWADEENDFPAAPMKSRASPEAQTPVMSFAAAISRGLPR
jgi:phosphorylated adapter RNA export protein